MNTRTRLLWLVLLCTGFVRGTGTVTLTVTHDYAGARPAETITVRC